MRKQSNLGFTLVELLLVIVIIGVLLGIGVPGFQGYLRKAHRSDAQQLILEIQSREQQYLLDDRKYTDVLNSSGLNISRDSWNFTNPTTIANSYYSVTVTVNNLAAPPSFTITATAIGTQTEDGNMTLTSVGQKTRTVGGVTKTW